MREWELKIHNGSFTFKVPIEGNVDELKTAITEICENEDRYSISGVKEIVNVPLEDLYDESSENYQG